MRSILKILKKSRSRAEHPQNFEENRVLQGKILKNFEENRAPVRRFAERPQNFVRAEHPENFVVISFKIALRAEHPENFEENRAPARSIRNILDVRLVLEKI